MCVALICGQWVPVGVVMHKADFWSVATDLCWYAWGGFLVSEGWSLLTCMRWIFFSENWSLLMCMGWIFSQ